MVFLARVSSLDSIVSIANWMSDRVPPASSSLAFRFSRLACDLEYGWRDASTSCGRFKFRNSDPGDVDLLSSSLACLSILFSFFGVTGFGPASVEDNVSRISVAYDIFVSPSRISVQLVWNCAYRQLVPAAYLDMFYLIFLDCELSLCCGLNSTVVSLGSETSCLWLHFQSFLDHGRRNGHSRRLAMFFAIKIERSEGEYNNPRIPNWFSFTFIHVIRKRLNV